MAKNETSTPAPVASGEKAQTSGGKVSLVMHKSQWPASVVKVEGVELSSDPVEVDAKTAERVLQRRDERGKKYAAEA